MVFCSSVASVVLPLWISSAACLRTTISAAGVVEELAVASGITGAGASATVVDSGATKDEGRGGTKLAAAGLGRDCNANGTAGGGAAAGPDGAAAAATGRNNGRGSGSGTSLASG